MVINTETLKKTSKESNKSLEKQSEAFKRLQSSLQVTVNCADYNSVKRYNSVCFVLLCDLIQDLFDWPPGRYRGGSVVHSGSSEDHHADMCRSERVCMFS